MRRLKNFRQTFRIVKGNIITVVCKLEVEHSYVMSLEHYSYGKNSYRYYIIPKEDYKIIEQLISS